jgi:hypothetical protein
VTGGTVPRYAARVSLYEIDSTGLTPHEPAAFADLGLYERADLQRLIRDDIDVLDDDLLVIAEEFGEWQDARRRIDLLAIDKTGCLVVIELKRTEDGGHMDLQALRYAAMVSSMDFGDVVGAYERHLAKTAPGDEHDARAELSAFIDAGVDEEQPTISTEVRIVLVSADFGRELMTAVLWLNRFEGMDIRCVQLVPYRLNDRVLLDIRQVVPLPEAADYQVRVRRKEQEQARVRTQNRDMTRYHVIVDGVRGPATSKRETMRVMVTSLIERGVLAADIADVIGVRFASVEGELENPVPIFMAEYKKEFGRKFSPEWWYIDHPVRQEGRTWLLEKGWSADNTEPTLESLVERFPQAHVSFQRADAA